MMMAVDFEVAEKEFERVDMVSGKRPSSDQDLLGRI